MLTPRRRSLGMWIVSAVIAALVIAWSTMTPRSPSSGGGPSVAPAQGWSLSVGNMSYSSDTTVGGVITVSMDITNSGSARNPGISVQFSDLDSYADLQGCTPSCDSGNLLGVYAHFPGVAPGTTQSDQITLVATKVGVAHWSLCIYDSTAVGGKQVWCGTATTTIS